MIKYEKVTGKIKFKKRCPVCNRLLGFFFYKTRIPICTASNEDTRPVDACCVRFFEKIILERSKEDAQ